MAQVTIPKTEYEQLRRQAEAYRKFTEKLFESVIRAPIEEIVEDFRKTGLYTEGFLRDLESGLRQSSYPASKAKLTTRHRGKKYGNKTTKRRS